MKKNLLLSGVALFAITNAEAMSWNLADYDPYIGADYVYDRAKNGGLAQDFKKNFHSAKFDLGMQMYKNLYAEFSYQLSGKLKNRSGYEDNTVKQSFMAYALDMYAKYPLMCSNLSALGTAGAAIYSLDYKGLPKSSTNRVGYRAGLGMQYDLTQHLAARVVGRYSYIGANRINNFKEVTAGMIYRF